MAPATPALLSVAVTLLIAISFFIIGRRQRSPTPSRCWFWANLFFAVALAALYLRAPTAAPVATTVLTTVLCSAATIAFVIEYAGVRSWLTPERQPQALLALALPVPLLYLALLLATAGATAPQLALLVLSAVVFPLLGCWQILRRRAGADVGDKLGSKVGGYGLSLFLLLQPLTLGVALILAYSGFTAPLQQSLAALLLHFSFPMAVMGGALFGLLAMLQQLLRRQRDHNLRDPLTAQYNRTGLLEFGAPLLEEARGSDQPLSLVAACVDDIAGLNERYGHHAGDTALQAFALQLQRKVRRSDLCGRWGGEQFLLLLPNCNESQACRVAESIREQLADSPIPLNGNNTVLGAHFAAAELNDSGEQLERRTEELLHCARLYGGSRVARIAGVQDHGVDPGAPLTAGRPL